MPRRWNFAAAVHGELFVRSFVSVTSRSDRQPAKAPEEQNPEAFVRWGGPSEFSAEAFRNAARGGVQVKLDDDEEPERPRFNYSESGRTFVDLLLVNPIDQNQYAVVRFTTNIVFTGPDNAVFTLHMATPS